MVSYRPPSASMLTTRRFVISGRVQGVGFRYFVQSIASRESLAGWVRNLDDGRVETAAAGDLEALVRFERAIRQGPSGARVDHVAVDETFPMTTAQIGFFIR